MSREQSDPLAPPLSETLAQRVGRLQGVVAGLSYEARWHREPWRNEAAKDLNRLLGRAAYILKRGGDGTDCAHAEATIRTVLRVAEMEGITRSGKLHH